MLESNQNHWIYSHPAIRNQNEAVLFALSFLVTLLQHRCIATQITSARFSTIARTNIRRPPTQLHRFQPLITHYRFARPTGRPFAFRRQREMRFSHALRSRWPTAAEGAQVPRSRDVFCPNIRSEGVPPLSEKPLSQLGSLLHSTLELDVPRMPEGVIAIGAIWYLWALFWGKILLASINETEWPGILAIAFFIIGVQTKDMIWLPLSIQPALCAVRLMFVGQRAHETSLFDKGALPPALWVCTLMTWLYCGAFYGQLYMVSNTYQHGAIDVIGGICGAVVLIKLSRLASERLPTVTRPLAWIGRNTLPLFCMHLIVLNAAPWSALFAWCGAHSIAVWPVMLVVHVVCSSVLTGGSCMCCRRW